MTVSVEQTLGRLAEAEELVRALDDQRRLAYVHYWIGVVYGIRNAMPQAREHAERVLAESELRSHRTLYGRV